MSKLLQTLGNILGDEGTRKAFVLDPHSVLQSAGLTPDEQSAILARDRNAIEALVGHELAQLDVVPFWGGPGVQVPQGPRWRVQQGETKQIEIPGAWFGGPEHMFVVLEPVLQGDPIPARVESVKGALPSNENTLTVVVSIADDTPPGPYDVHVTRVFEGQPSCSVLRAALEVVAA